MELGDWFYASDAGGIDALLYDRQSGEAFIPDFKPMISAALPKDCSIRIGGLPGFDASSRVRMVLRDDMEEGGDQPDHPCLCEGEQWLLDPVRLTLRPAFKPK